MSLRKQQQTTTLSPGLFKHVLEANKKVGRKKEEISELTAFVTEQFIEEFLQQVIAKDQNQVTIPSMIEVIRSNPQYDFLEPLIPELQRILTPEANESTA